MARPATMYRSCSRPIVPIRRCPSLGCPNDKGSPPMASNFTALNPEGYQKIMGRFSRRLAHAFIGFAGSAPGENILDVGCGTGSMTETHAERGDHASIVGIDVSEPYVAFARARNKDPRITFDIGDASS